MKKCFAGMLGILVILGGVLAGCGASSNNETGGNVSKSSMAFEYKTLTFDNYGREVTITAKPTKVLTLGPNTTELFVALGLTDFIIGNSLDNHSRGALPEYEGDYARIPELTYGSATREAVITSGADFIYGIDWEFGSEGLDEKELAGMGIPSYKNSASTMDDIYQEIRDIGQIFEIEVTAEQYVTKQQERIAAVQEKIKGKEPVKVLVYDSGGDGVFTAGKSNFETLLIEFAGGKNIFDDIADQQWTTVSYEEVLKRKPDVILIHDYDIPSLEQKISDIKNDPALSQLESVQNGNFVAISLESVLPGNRMAYTVETLAKGFYPELFD
ncbi:ABC transporter substrate-binding protein [Paenibacillus nasutitermitis]|uniref:Lipoprotein n=1 Tax=Paenibacillus nasutitermitis TaxID=1652958 RepID=A0A916YUR7_9BACL|nr:ABC transporter substrate-binding protein [Paenibacillus nasutitermitis]GGD60732.1 lipoprotein [Paenibacillus nasutitermitis]